jgi:DNA-binding CsgD family transcriptional regulator
MIAKFTNEMRLEKGRLTREALVEMRIAGLSIKEATAVIGISVKTYEWHWAKIRRKCGMVSDMAIAAWAAKTPAAKWALCLAAIVFVGCKSAPAPVATTPTAPTAPISGPTLPTWTPPAAKLRSKAIVQPPPLTNAIPIIYPPNASDFKYATVRSSTNMIDWPIYEAPFTNGDDSVTMIPQYNLRMPPSGVLNASRRYPKECFKVELHNDPKGPFLPAPSPDPYVVPWDPVTDPPWGTNAPPN